MTVVRTAVMRDSIQKWSIKVDQWLAEKGEMSNKAILSVGLLGGIATWVIIRITS